MSAHAAGGKRGLSQLRDLRKTAEQIRRDYRLLQGRKLPLARILRPRRYSEKMQWRKLFDRDPRFTQLVDKLAVRAILADRVGADALVPLLWHGAPDDIPFDALTPPYVLKSTHGSGHTRFVRAGEPVDADAIRATARGWLAHCHGTTLHEPAYIPVPRRVIAEPVLAGADGAPLLERRFFVFDGVARVVNTVFVEDGRVRNGAFHTAAWQRLPWRITRDLGHVPFPRPPLLDVMRAAAERAAAGFDHLRVDVYDGGDRFWIGELTVYSWSGYAPLAPDAADFVLGGFWRLRRPLLRAGFSLLR
jgi:hypothetical protein